MIKVRFATTEDSPALIEFIRDHWSVDHVFTLEPDLFAWQYAQPDGRLNMMLAEQIDETGNAVVGILGFIPMGRFDPDLGDRDVTLAIWKVRDGSPPGLGLRLLKQLTAELQPRVIAAIGISDVVKPIYGVLRYDVARLEQVALFNPAHRNRIRIAAGVPDAAFETVTAPTGPLVELSAIERDAPRTVRDAVDQIGRSALLAKSWAYVRSRYLEHPWYDYAVWLVHHAGAPTSIVIWRQVEAEGTRVLRIVDVIGSTEWLADAGGALLDRVDAADAEYIDLMYWGIDDDIIRTSGFVGRSQHPEMVIPNYFSPFERRNVAIDLACRVFEGDVTQARLFRADSDQDRPNIAADLTRRR